MTIERYVVNSPESILLLPLITQPPKIKVKGVVCAKLEKILVDIFSDEDQFFIFHGQEMINICDNAILQLLDKYENIIPLCRQAEGSRTVETFHQQRDTDQISNTLGEY